LGALMSSQLAAFQPAVNDQELEEQQHHVQRLLGRCLLRLQQYERLMKAIAAHHEIAGPAHELKKVRAAHIDDASTKTLGNLVGQLFGSCVVTEGTGTAADPLANEPDDVVCVAMRMHLELSAEDYDRTQRGLKELVLLRNKLVHHFIDQHDLWSTDGCLTARDALVSAYERIDAHFEQLRGWAENMAQARRQYAEFVQSDAFEDWLVNGIAPDGKVNWPAAGIVRALREAENELAVDGWTPVAAAARWIMERSPEQQPNKYGCASWRQVVHESRLFELRYRDVDGRRAASYRAYPSKRID
jgi:hypothetical protein